MRGSRGTTVTGEVQQKIKKEEKERENSFREKKEEDSGTRGMLDREIDGKGAVGDWGPVTLMGNKHAKQS